MKLRETISDVLNAVIAAPEAIRELRAYATEADARECNRMKMRELRLNIEGLAEELKASGDPIGDRSSIQFQLSCALKRVTELEIENRKLLDQNWSLVAERDAAIVARESVQSELKNLQRKTSPVIAPPDPGKGFELCERNEATEAMVSSVYRDGSARFVGQWHPLVRFTFDAESSRYAFRRPIAKVEPKWVACTAEEAKTNPDVSEWLNDAMEWARCVGDETQASCAYRSTAALPEWVTVTPDIWKSKELEDCERQRESPTRVDEWYCKVKRSDVTIGTVLG